MNFTKEEKEIGTMTTEGLCKGSEKIHNRRKKKERQEDILCFEKHMQEAAR